MNLRSERRPRKEEEEQFLQLKFFKNVKLRKAVFRLFFYQISKMNPLSCTTGLALSYKAIKMTPNPIGIAGNDLLKSVFLRKDDSVKI